MSTQEICSMIDEFVDLGTSRLSLTGGEPLIREDFGIIVNYAKKRGLSVSLSTNGSLVAKRIDQLEGIDSINMTLDGPEVIHDQQRGKGNFKEVLKAIELIKAKKIPLYLVSVITKNNCNSLDETLKFAKLLDTKLLIQPVFYAEQSHANNLEGYMHIKYDDKVMLDTVNYLIKLKKQGESTIILSERYYQNIKKAIVQGRKIKCCNAGSLFCTVSPDGKVAPCNLLVRDNCWLDGNRVSFKNAFLNMPNYNCEGCISSFLDIDYLYSFKPDVVWNYYKHYLAFFVKTSSPELII